ncbi:hypothetical protein NQ317_017460, partial [Molorchus minor]
LPEFSPQISVNGEPFDYGGVLRANCTSSPSRPKASLKFILNDLTVARSEPLLPRQYQETAYGDLAVEMVLYEFHFNEGGKLILRCVADIADVYHEEAVLSLHSKRNPVPERG